MSNGNSNIFASDSIGILDRAIQQISLPERETSRFISNEGLTIILEPARTYPLTSIDLLVKAGSLNEWTYQKNGLAHLVEHLVLRVERFPQDLVWLKRDIIGETFFDRTEYRLISSSENVELALHTLFCLLRGKEFDQPSFEIEKEVIAQEMDLLNRHEDELLSSLFWESVFLEDNLQSASLENQQPSLNDAYQFYKREYAPQNTILAIAGDFRCRIIEEFVNEMPSCANREIFEGLQKRKSFYPMTNGSAVGSRNSKIIHRVTNSGIARELLGYIIESFSSNQLQDLDLLSVVINLKIRRKLARRKNLSRYLFNLYTFFYPLENTGLFLIKSAFRPQVGREVQELVSAVVSEIKTELLSQEELALAKAHLLNLQLSRYTLANRARALALSEARGLSSDFNASYAESVKMASSAGVVCCAQRHLDDRKLRRCVLMPNKARC